jgi:hypothetical protein
LPEFDVPASESYPGEDTHMSGSGHPGETFEMECTEKTVTGKSVTISFVAKDGSTDTLTTSPRQAEYFSVGVNYLIPFTPKRNDGN